MNSSPLHSFHIPVMGLAYTIDTPVKVARFGISSVVSIIEDNLIEKMRSYYYPKIREVYTPIPPRETDFRARRITDYLNLINRIVKGQVDVLREEPFEPGSEISKYFEMLADGSDLKRIYEQMLVLTDPEDKLQLENWLRMQVQAGSIDVNIMTKLDRNHTDNLGNPIEDGSDAVAALRGYLNSDLTNSSIVLSAGMNPRLFNYMEKMPALDADHLGLFAKKITLKVSDFRSAHVQGKMLAKKGLWVSEFRIESGLNCGGHAFATDGYLLGPILEEFKTRRNELVEELFTAYSQALAGKDKPGFERPHPVRITVQGGIGTYEEDQLLRQYYGMDGTGWGTPFLLVPEATTVDENTLQLLSNARERDVVLSRNSPLGIRFHYLKGTTAEKEKLGRIRNGMPGSPCTEKFLVSNTEFGGEPICTASRTYQKKKLAQLKSLNLPEEDCKRQMQDVLDKECLCIGLSNSAIRNYGVKPFRKLEGVNICPGPNIAYFSRIVSLREMVDHIYGRINILPEGNRPHMFIKELALYMDYWMEMLSPSPDAKREKQVKTFCENILNGIAYYRNLFEQVTDDVILMKRKMGGELDAAEKKLREALQQIGTGALAAVPV